jgi:hypothetical protein
MLTLHQTKTIDHETFPYNIIPFPNIGDGRHRKSTGFPAISPELYRVKYPIV